VQHLQLDCRFSTAIREKIFTWNGTIGTAPTAARQGIHNWWDDTIRGLPKDKRGEAWKERNRRVF
jgi:hypothetical protein